MEQQINELFLNTLSKKYELYPVSIIEDFLCFQLNNKRRSPKIYLLLSNDWKKYLDTSIVLETIDIFEGEKLEETYYFVVLPKNNPTIDNYTAFKGISFVYFVFYDEKEKKLFGTNNKNFFEIRIITELKRLYQRLFDKYSD